MMPVRDLLRRGALVFLICEAHTLFHRRLLTSAVLLSLSCGAQESAIFSPGLRL